ncbi:MAG: PAS domain S-box protein [Armatimonadetes bacterium]|nr:PAS domain S-box protein [Armatimonadota bacterium]
MTIERYESGSLLPRTPRWVGYAATVLLEAAVTLGLVLLSQVFPLAKYPIPYVLLTMLVAYLFGTGPAVLAVALGWFAYTYVATPPIRFAWPPAASTEEWAGQLALLLGLTVVAIAMTQARKSSRRIAERTLQLEAEMRDRGRAEEKIRHLNAELEQRVIQRTAELDDAIGRLDLALEQERKARAVAEASDTKITRLLEMAPDGIIIVNREGNITFANNQAAGMFIYKPNDLTGKPIEQLIPESYRDVHVRHRADYVADPRTRPMGVGLELYGLRSDGTEFPVEIALSPTWTEGELSVTAIVRDVTKRKQAEEQIKRLNRDLEQRATELEAANKELESFSYSVSHDLRAPLRAIDGFSDALLKHYRDSLDARGQDYLHRVRAAAQRMARLIDDILDLSRASRADVHRQRVDLSATAREIVDYIQKSQPERTAQINIAENLTVDADPHLLRIALDNLLGNAWKFTGSQDIAAIELGRIELNGEKVYYVKDNGAGFDPKYADKLFSPFQRLHNESEFPGTGIGLALTQHIVRKHGGRIWAESAVDQGATFYFTLGEATK